MNSTNLNIKCPVCQAQSGSPDCPDCGADLKKLLTITVQASVLRDQAQTALINKNYNEAVALSTQAQALQQTAAGQKLLDIACILASVRLELM